MYTRFVGASLKRRITHRNCSPWALAIFNGQGIVSQLNTGLESVTTSAGLVADESTGNQSCTVSLSSSSSSPSLVDLNVLGFVFFVLFRITPAIVDSVVAFDSHRARTVTYNNVVIRSYFI